MKVFYPGAGKLHKKMLLCKPKYVHIFYLEAIDKLKNLWYYIYVIKRRDEVGKEHGTTHCRETRVEEKK